MRRLVGMVVWLAAAGLAHGEKTCTIEGHASDRFAVEVPSQGGPSLKLSLSGMPVLIHPPQKEGPARVEVRGPIAFDATAAFDKIPYKSRSALDSNNGMVHLAAGAQGLTVRARGKWAQTDLVLGPIRLRGLFFPCSGFTVDPVASGRETADAGEESWEAAAPMLHLRSGASSGEVVIVEIAEEGRLEFARLEQRGDWVRVSSHWPDGTSLTGWLKKTELKRNEQKLLAVLKDDRVVGALTGGLPGSSATCVHAGAPSQIATVAAGTRVLADRLFPWATVRGGDPLAVRHRASESWVQIVAVPPATKQVGECEDETVLDDAWVPLSAVHFVNQAPDGGTR